MKINTKFDIYESVLIIGLGDFPGTIQEIKVDSADAKLLYYIEYWWDGGTRGAWLHEHELKPVNA